MQNQTFQEAVNKFYQQNNRALVLNISGNIGAGKSTFCKGLREIGCYIIDEPVKEMQNYQGRNILDEFYKGVISPVEFQKMVIEIIIKVNNEEYKKAINLGYKVIVCDRSLIDTVETFTYMCSKELYNEVKDTIYQRMHFNIDYYIFLELHPTICHYRIKKRGRVEEKNIKLQYLQDYNESLVRFYFNMRSEYKEKVIKISSEQTTKEMVDEMEEVILESLI